MLYLGGINCNIVDPYQKRMGSINKEKGVIYGLEQMWPKQNVISIPNKS